jgi:hypothetical protein
MVLSTKFPQNRGYETATQPLVTTRSKVPPAVVGAILDALRPLGIDHIDMPATPNRIWQALNALGTTKAAAE